MSLRDLGRAFGKARGSIMIDAVSAVTLNFSSLRGSAEQVASVRSYAANPEKIQEAAQAPYISPYIHVDVDFDRAVLQIRDSDTGDVVRQFPSESELESRRRASAQAQAASTDIPDPVQTSEGRGAGDSGGYSVKSSGTESGAAHTPDTASTSNAPATSQQLAAFTAGAQTAAASSQTGTVVATEA